MFSTRLLTTVTRLSSHVFKRTTRSSFSQSQEKHVAELINDKIRGTKVMVFSKSYCPFCTKAKRVFEELIDDSKLSMEDYEVLEIEDDPRCDDIQAHLGELTGAKSVPRVFINQQCLGGGDEVAAAFHSGELVKLLTDS